MTPTGRPLRVALVTPTLDIGGAERQMLLLAGALPRDEFDVRFVVMAHPGPLAQEAHALGKSVRELGLRTGMCQRPDLVCLRATFGAVRDYRRAVRDVDVVDAWLVPAITFVGLLRPLIPVPVLMAGRRSLADVARPRSRSRRLAASLAMGRADMVVANSEAAADDLIRVDGLDTDRVRVIRNAVEPAMPADRTAIRATWGMGPADIVVGCVSRLRPGKGLLELVGIAARLHERRPELRWVIVGQGPLEVDLRAEIDGARLTEILHLEPTVSDARTVYPAFDLLVQASDSEGLPNAILEGSAAGLPIVATAVGGTPEIVAHGESALLVPARDAEALTAAVERLLDHTNLRRTLGARARRRADAFSATALATATGALYRELAARRD